MHGIIVLFLIFAIVPLGAIISLNGLFDLDIDLNWKNWGMTLFLMFVYVYLNAASGFLVKQYNDNEEDEDGDQNEK